MKYLALSQMCSIFAPLVPMHAGLLQRSVQESTKEMASLLDLKIIHFCRGGGGLVLHHRYIMHCGTYSVHFCLKGGLQCFS